MGPEEKVRVKDVYERIAPYLANPRQIKDILASCEGRSREEAITLIEARMRTLSNKESETLKTDLSILLSELLHG